MVELLLRKADEKKNILQFHSDIRSSKIEIVKKTQIVLYCFIERKKKYNLG